MKAENRSFWGLAARGSLPCALGIMGLMTVLEPILFRAMSWKSEALEFAVRDANLFLVFTLAMVNLIVALCNRSALGAGRETLRRLRLDGRTQFRILAAQNALCAGLLWAWQAVLAVLLCLWWGRAHPDAAGAHTLYLAFYRVSFLHALLPLGDWLLWIRNIVYCAVVGVGTAKAALTGQKVGPLVVCCAGAAFWPAGMGTEILLIIEIAFLLFCGWVSWAFGRDAVDPAEET